MSRGLISRKFQGPKGQTVTLQHLNTQFVSTQLTPEESTSQSASASSVDTHSSDTNNPHSVTFTQAVDADAGTDITVEEAETLTDGSNADALHSHTMLLRDPVTDFWDPTGGLPVGPSDGDRYIASETANGWTQDFIYEWDDAAGVWIESEPDEGWMLWVILEFMLYFFFSGGWVESDMRVAVDSSATPGYIGAASNDGVLRVSSPLTYTDGGDFVTIGLQSSASVANMVCNNNQVICHDNEVVTL